MKVLVVDDELVSRQKMNRLLQGLGYETRLAAGGVEGFEIWKSEQPRIVITDWNMPEMDGLQLCRQIRAAACEDYTYVIFVSGNGDIQDVIAGMEAGADDYIHKPFNQGEVKVRVKAGERVINLQSKETVIFALAKLAESRDEDTGNHLERVRYYSKSLAEALMQMPDAPPELDGRLIENIFLTSSLHDIGKVGIPDYILLKPGRLDDKEFEIMKSHTVIGFRTLTEALQKTPEASYLRVAAEIARHHHEKYDGSGYPDGLRGERIPIASRIFALSDVYDALVSKRPYKEPFTHERARSIVTDGRGSHFDPLVVEAFLACEQRFVDIYDQYRSA
jgi:putative two-component system response regulator